MPEDKKEKFEYKSSFEKIISDIEDELSSEEKLEDNEKKNVAKSNKKEEFINLTDGESGIPPSDNQNLDSSLMKEEKESASYFDNAEEFSIPLKDEDEFSLREVEKPDIPVEEDNKSSSLNQYQPDDSFLQLINKDEKRVENKETDKNITDIPVVKEAGERLKLSEEDETLELEIGLDQKGKEAPFIKEEESEISDAIPLVDNEKSETKDNFKFDSEDGFGLNVGSQPEKEDDEPFRAPSLGIDDEKNDSLRGETHTEEEIRPGFKVYRTKEDEQSLSEKSEKVKIPEDPSQKTVLFELQFKPRLELVSGKMPQKTYELSKDEIMVGRGRESDIILFDSNASRNHSRIFKEGGDYYIEDLDSRNGTMINGKFVKREKLSCHDIICFGEISFEFLEGEEKASESPPKIMEVSDVQEVAPPPILPKFEPKKRGLKLSPEKRRKFAIYFFFFCTMFGTIYNKEIRPRLERKKIEKQRALKEAISKKEEVAVDEKTKMLNYFLNQGKYLFDNSKYSEAQEKFIEALKINPQNEEALAMKDKCESAIALKNEMDEQKKSEVLARERTERVSELEKQVMAAFNKGELSESLSILEELAKIEPKNELVKRYIPIIRAKKSELSKQATQTARKKELIEERIKLADKYYYDRNIYGAILELKKAIKEGELPPETKRSMQEKLESWERELTDKLKSKLESSQTLWENGEKMQARRLLSEILAEYPDYREAKVEYERITQKIQEEAYNHYNNGRVFEANDDIVNAIDSYEKVLTLLEPTEEYYKKAKEKLASLKHFQ